MLEGRHKDPLAFSNSFLLKSKSRCKSRNESSFPQGSKLAMSCTSLAQSSAYFPDSFFPINVSGRGLKKDFLALGEGQETAWALKFYNDTKERSDTTVVWAGNFQPRPMSQMR